MSDYCIISDSSCDLSKETTAKENITVVPFYVSFDEKTYMKEGVDISIRDFYQKMVDNKNVFPKSSLPSVQDYIETFEPIIKQGKGIVCICITSKFSGSVQSATNAKHILLETYPDAKIEVIDSMVDTVLQGLFTLEAAKMCKAGVPMDACVKELLSMRESGRIFFTIGNIDYLKHGGRIGKLSGLAASVLGIKPLITLKDGEIYNSGISRSRKASQVKVIELLKQYIKEENIDMKKWQLCVGFGYDYDEAVAFQKLAVDSLGGLITEKDCPIYQIGATIGVHTGPYPLGFGIIKKQTLC
jgi:DegV family protein with EDD domain